MHLSGTEEGVTDAALVSGRIMNVPVVLQSQAPLIATAQKQLKIHRLSFLLWKTCPAVLCLRRSHILTAIPRALHRIPLDPF